MRAVIRVVLWIEKRKKIGENEGGGGGRARGEGRDGDVCMIHIILCSMAFRLGTGGGGEGQPGERGETPIPPQKENPNYNLPITQATFCFLIIKRGKKFNTD